MAEIRAESESVRVAAVAGQFYPANPDSLRNMVTRYLSRGHRFPVAPRIVIGPHAGYIYSGPVAGMGYATIDPAIKRVIIIGPAHYVPVSGLAVPGASWFETPLGRVLVDRTAISRLLKNPIAYVGDQAHRPEHSLEVQLPFLQVRLGSFSIVPIIAQEVDPQTAADCIYPLIDAQTLVVASSDLSHYMSQDRARREDDRTIEAICTGQSGGDIDACGECPIRVVMALAKKMGVKPLLIDKQTSYDTSPEAGPDRVVGYASIVFIPEVSPVAVSHPVKKNGTLSAADRSFLLGLARQSLEASVKGERLPQPDAMPEAAKENRGCFVTLTVRGELRGCIGYIEPVKPLGRAVIENARNAALSDPRFPPVTPDELPSIKVEVSVLTNPEPLEYSDPADLLRKLVPDIDGVILQKGSLQSTFLPQVWEQLPDKVQFLEHLAMKGGMDRNGWKTALVKRYRAEHFGE